MALIKYFLLPYFLLAPALAETTLSEKEAAELVTQARQLKLSGNFEKALSLYEQLSATPIARAILKSEIEDTKTSLANPITSEEAYLSNFEIIELTAKRSDIYGSGPVPVIRVGVKNNGRRSISELTVTVYFQDKKGSTIYEQDWKIINKAQTKPLKAGYTWEMSPNSVYSVDSALSQWEDGKATAAVTKIKFDD